ncbi:ABC transporter substrate-binding protein [bacterium]|nr:MAG: ABC transporter substrate-binding protein [bacterium]
MFSIIFAIIITLFTNSVQNSSDARVKEIKNLLEKRDVEIKALLGAEGSTYTDAQKDKLKEIINGIIDYDAMAQVALQETYSEITVEQKTEFVDVFGTIIRDQSLAKLDIYRAKVTYESIEVEGNTAYVKTMAELKDVKTPVSYSMAYKGGQWMITDMVIDNVSTADSYKTSFQRVIKKKGYESLMKSLRKRAARGE